MIYNKFDNFTHWYNNFQYWFAHWCAFNMTAMNMGVWKFHHLFHDIEKPWLGIFLAYGKVHKRHISKSKHHIEYYRLHGECNWTDLVIDWECSQFTKEKGKLTAREFLEKLLASNNLTKEEGDFISTELEKYGL